MTEKAKSNDPGYPIGDLIGEWRCDSYEIPPFARNDHACRLLLEERGLFRAIDNPSS